MPRRLTARLRAQQVVGHDRKEHAMTAREATVLVGVDGAEDSLLAVDWAAAEAMSLHCGLTICHAVPFGPPFDATADPAADPLLAQGRHVVRQAAARARAVAPELGITEVVSSGSPAPALLDGSAAAQLLVVGSRGTGAFRGLLLGSVGQQVAAHAACPVVVIRPAPGNPPLPADAPATVAPVTVAIDWSGYQPLLAFAFDHAARHHRPLVAVHAYQVPTAPPDPAAARSVLPIAVDDLLTDAVAPWRDKYPEVRARTLAIDGTPAAGLIDRSTHSALLVVGSRGHGGFAGLLLGSVSQHVLRHGHCPVAVIR
jgi:nucleotide-binding universal stress UspA family protein